MVKILGKTEDADMEALKGLPCSGDDDGEVNLLFIYK